MQRSLFATAAAFVVTGGITGAQQPPARPMSPQGSAQVQVLGSWVKGERPAFTLGRETYQGGKWIEIAYGRPLQRGRDLFGSGPNYGKAANDVGTPTFPAPPVWRAGANQTTRLKTEVPLVLGTTTVPAGEYSLFVDLKGPREWTLIVSRWPAQAQFDPNNKEALWGAYGYTPDKDVVRVPMKVDTLAFDVDQLTWSFVDMTNDGGKFALIWGKSMATTPFKAVRVAAEAPIRCDALGQVKIANGTILSAESVAAGAFAPPSATNAPNAAASSAFKALPAFCRVTAKLTPSSDSDIRVEVWLPLSGWNRKLQAVGNGGLGGSISYTGLAAAVRAGYAAAATDTGHVGGNADFVAGHPEKLVDFGHRAIHEMTLSAKTVIAAHYETRPARSYFNACSTGGRQALIEAQRYPEDFDGIISGDPSWDQMRLYAARVYLNVYVNREPAAVIPPAKYPMLHDAVLNACDAKDGVKDGVLENPAQCSFDFASLTCTGEDRADCLTRPQVETAKAMSTPIIDRKGGAVLHPGKYYPGSELGWGGVGGPTPSGESHEGMKKIVFTPAWDYHTIKVPDDVERAVRADKGLLYGGDPNLSRFFNRGGKLLMYHGWADPLVSPDTSLIMYKRIQEAVGAAAAAKSVALFMVPGMGHCAGGPGTDVFDKVAALDQWVESGAKPQSIVASHLKDGVADRTRPLCAYPATAHYVGSGSSDEAKNFRCQTP